MHGKPPYPPTSPTDILELGQGTQIELVSVQWDLLEQRLAFLYNLENEIPIECLEKLRHLRESMQKRGKGFDKIFLQSGGENDKSIF